MMGRGMWYVRIVSRRPDESWVSAVEILKSVRSRKGYIIPKDFSEGSHAMEIYDIFVHTRSDVMASLCEIVKDTRMLYLR